jgi:hypothetical protein
MVPVDSLDETSWDELQVLVFWGALRTSEVIRVFPEIINAPAIRSGSLICTIAYEGFRNDIPAFLTAAQDGPIYLWVF